MFYNAAGTFFMHKLVLQYFYSLKASYTFNQNFILLCLQNKTFLTLLRSLGILCKIITGPYFLKATEVGNILDMGSVFQRLLYVLDLFIENPILALNNEVSLFYGPYFYDEVFEFLLKTSLNDNLTCVFIKRLCNVLKRKASKLFSEFLSGGKYFNISGNELKECNSCDTNNICLERLMGQLDFKLKASSTSSLNSIESSILYCNNRTEEWLKKKDISEQQEIIDQARSENRTFMLKDREKNEELFRKQTKILEEKEKEARRKKEKKSTELDRAIEDMRKVGLWESEGKIREEIEKLKTKKEKVETLKKQINIYKKVFKIEKNQKELLQFSSKGKVFDHNKLLDNLLKLIELRRNAQETRFHPDDLVGKEIVHTWTIESGENQDWEGQIRSFENGVYKVVYWDDKERKNGSEFELTEREINIDIQEGNLFIKDTTKLDHCYSTF
ncbi:myb-like protein X [Saccostrea echinata]|uniref:myb-like protein X n=2 Tax=Saccostrea echinata TaxID=191078 RepID=UPI002A823757|nr:myb-like protein X [Saccostrea echinata]XP_061192149.1 myb-like protein X [Saccostrea echinata]